MIQLCIKLSISFPQIYQQPLLFYVQFSSINVQLSILLNTTSRNARDRLTRHQHINQQVREKQQASFIRFRGCLLSRLRDQISLFRQTLIILPLTYIILTMDNQYDRILNQPVLSQTLLNAQNFQITNFLNDHPAIINGIPQVASFVQLTDQTDGGREYFINPAYLSAFLSGVISPGISGNINMRNLYFVINSPLITDETGKENYLVSVQYVLNKLMNYYTKSEIDGIIAGYVTLVYLQANYYDKSEIDGFFADQLILINTKADQTYVDTYFRLIADSYSIVEIDAQQNAQNDEINLKAPYTYVDGGLALKVDMTYLLANYYDTSYIDSLILNYYTKSEIDTIFLDYYTQSQIDSFFALYSTTTQIATLYYNKTYIDNLIALYYTKVQSDAKFATLLLTYSRTYIDSLIALYYTMTQTDTLLNLKTNQSFLLANYEDTTTNHAYISTNYYDKAYINSLPSASYAAILSPPTYFWYGNHITTKQYITLTDIDPNYFLFLKDTNNNFPTVNFISNLLNQQHTVQADYTIDIQSGRTFKVQQFTSGNKIEINGVTNDINISTQFGTDDINISSSNQILFNAISQVLFTCNADFGIQMAPTSNLLIQTPSLAASLRISNADNVILNGADLTITATDNLVLNSTNLMTVNSSDSLDINVGNDYTLTVVDELKLICTGSSNAILLENHDANIKLFSDSRIIVESLTNYILLNTADDGIYMQGDLIQLSSASATGFTTNIKFEFNSNAKSLLSFYNNTTKVMELYSDSGTATSSAVWNNTYNNSINSVFTHQLRYLGTQIVRYNNTLNLWVATSSSTMKTDIKNVSRDPSKFYDINFQIYKFKKQPEDDCRRFCGIVIENIEQMQDDQLKHLIDYAPNDDGTTEKHFNYRDFHNLCLRDCQQLLKQQDQQIGLLHSQIDTIHHKMEQQQAMIDGMFELLKTMVRSPDVLSPI